MFKQNQMNYFEEIYQLAKKGDEESIKRLDELLARGICIDERQQGNPFLTALTKLAKEQDWPAVALLKNRGANQWNIALGMGLSNCSNHVTDPETAQSIAIGAVLGGHHEYSERLRTSFKIPLNDLARSAAFAGYREYAERLRALGADVNEIARAAAMGGHRKYVEELRALGASLDNIAYGYAYGGYREYAEELRMEGASPQLIASGAARGDNRDYAEELRRKFNLNTIELAISAINGGHFSYAEELRSKHNTDIDRMIEVAEKTQWMNYVKSLKAIKEMMLKVKTAPPTPSTATLISNTKLQISREIFSTKLKELTGIELSDEMVKLAYNHWIQPAGSQLAPVPASFITYSDHITGKLMKFKTDDILHCFFESTSISKLTKQEQALLKEFRFIVHGTKRADGSITPVYRYSHSLGARGKPEIELSFIQLYALFNYLLYFHVLTVENNDVPIGYLHAHSLLEGLSDQNGEIEFLRVELIPPTKPMWVNQLLSLLAKIAGLEFDPSQLQNQSGGLPYIPPSQQSKLKPLRFTQFFKLTKQAVAESYSRLFNGLTIVLQDIASSDAEKEKISEKTKLLNTINEALQQLDLNSVLIDNNLHLPEDDHKKRLLRCLLQEVWLAKKISGNNQVAAQGKKPFYDKSTGKGDIIEDNSLFYWRLKYSSQTVADILDIPEIQVLIDNLASPVTSEGRLVIYSETAPYKIVATYEMPQFDSNDFVPCPDDGLQVLELVLSSALTKKRLKLAAQEKKNTFRERYKNATNAELLARYNQMGGVCFVRKLRLTEDSDGTNPLHAFLKKYNGEHILPASLIKRGLVASTYIGAWQSCAGLLILPSLEEDQLVAGFKRPANSNQLKGIHLARSRVGSALQATGGKPYSSLQLYQEKLFSNQQKAMFAIEDKDSLELIGTFVTTCRNSNKHLITNPLNQQLWTEIETAFKNFLSQYVSLLYGIPPQATDQHSVYQEAMKKFKTRFFNRVGKNANNFESLYKQTIAEKKDKTNKRKYAKQPMLLSEVLLQINLQKRTLNLGDDEEAVIRELLIERCGEVGAVFVQMNVASISDALTIGEALKAYHGDSYEPIYVVLDERHLLDAAGMDMAIEKTGILAFKSEEELLKILTQADISKDLATIKTEIKARITTPERQMALPPQLVVTAATSPPLASTIGTVAKPSSSSAVTKFGELGLGLLTLNTISTSSLSILEGLDLSQIKTICFDKSTEAFEKSLMDKLTLIFKKCPEATIHLQLPECYDFITSPFLWSQFVTTLQINRAIHISTSQSFFSHPCLERLGELKSCKSIKLVFTQYYDSYVSAFRQLLTSLPPEVHCTIPWDYLKGCRDINFHTLTIDSGDHKDQQLELLLSSKAKVKRLSSMAGNLDFLVKSMPFSNHGPIILATATSSDFLTSLPKKHSLAALELRSLTHTQNIGEIVVALEKMPLKPTILLEISGQHLNIYRSLTAPQLKIFKELVAQRVILFKNKDPNDNVYKSFSMSGQRGQTRGQELIAIITDPANCGSHLSYEDLINIFIARQRELEQKPAATASRFTFLPPPVTTSSATSIQAQSAPSATSPAVTAPSAPRKRSEHDEDPSGQDTKRTTRRRN